MRLWIDGFHNLNDVTVEFDQTSLTTVIIGQNGSGKSYLLEAIVRIFRNADLDIAPPPFRFKLDYRIGNQFVTLSSEGGSWIIEINGISITRGNFQANKSSWFPDMVFSYYSGTNNRMESLFDHHQEKYYRKLIADNSEDIFKFASIEDRRLFYARPIHGVLALLSLLTCNDPKITDLLKDMLGVTGFHSAMLLLRKPWYAENKRNADPEQFWGAGGRPARAARLVRKQAFFPMPLTERARDDYRSKGKSESQYAIYLRNREALMSFAGNFENDLQLFEELESIDISDLYRWVQVWVTRVGAEDGEVSYGQMSEGERQLLMVLGLIRLSRNKRTLFLLDEPDTHLNPRWQYEYLDLIRRWAETSGDRCHVLLTTHNPLTIASLTRPEVRVMHLAEDGKSRVTPPYADPRGMGFTATLTEIFGLASSLDEETQKQVDDRNALARLDQRTSDQEKQLIEINDKLNRLGFMNEDREPLYQDFLRAWQDVRYADRPPMTPADIEKRHRAMQALIKQLIDGREAAH